VSAGPGGTRPSAPSEALGSAPFPARADPRGLPKDGRAGGSAIPIGPRCQGRLRFMRPMLLGQRFFGHLIAYPRGAGARMLEFTANRADSE
jgi:hypothetical protein